MDFDCIFSEILSQRNLLEQFVKQYRNSNKKLFLFGAQNCGRGYLHYLNEHGIAVEGFIDNYKHSMDDLRVLRLDEVIKSYPKEDCIFLITAPRYVCEIREQLLAEFRREQIYSFAAWQYIWFNFDLSYTREYLAAHRNELKSLYYQLYDNKSKTTLIHMLRGRITSDWKDFCDVHVSDDYYVPEIISLQPDEVLVELGANNGDTLADFIRRCPKFKCVYCFEPDQTCLTALKQVAAPYGSKIQIIEKIAWKEETVLKFICDENNSELSKIDAVKGGKEIEATSVDIAVTEDITFLKMDVEGAELEALQGARQHILRNRPKLAVCVYHKPEDIVEIPKYLNSLDLGYHFYLRHHGVDDSDTILYAV